MDYTGASGTALTPCQLSTVNANLYNPGNPANSYRNYLATSWCDEVPPRANFTMAACLSPGNVRMDSRATFLADRMTIKVYAYNATTATTGGLLATYTRPVARGGNWNLAPLYGFVANQFYYVTLTATRSSGQSHTRGQVIRVESPCSYGIVVTPTEP